MTPIYGRSTWHNPCATLVPPRVKNGQSGTGWHKGGTHPVPLLEAFYRVNQAGGTSGTTARMPDKKSVDVGKSDGNAKYIHLTEINAILLCRRATPKNPRPHMGV